MAFSDDSAMESRLGEFLNGRIGRHLGRRAFRRIVWRVGPGGKLSSRFAFRRVKVAHDDGTDAGDREPMSLMIDWPAGESKPSKFVLTTLPRRMSKKQIVRIVNERWRTERAYEELKGELGLDHFEGRSFPRCPLCHRPNAGAAHRHAADAAFPIRPRPDP